MYDHVIQHIHNMYKRCNQRGRPVTALQLRLAARQPLQEAGEQGHMAEAIRGATAIEVVALHGKSEGILACCTRRSTVSLSIYLYLLHITWFI